MSRSKTKPLVQTDEDSCGPAALKVALQIIGIRISYRKLVEYCHTNTRGTTLPNLIKAANKAGATVLTVEWATLRHLQSVLKTPPQRPLSAIVDYFYDGQYEDTGHYAAVAAYSSRLSKIIIFDSYTGRKKSYLWTEFLDRWYGFDHKRKKIPHRSNRFKLSKKWHNRLLLILAKDKSYLPEFTISTAKTFTP
jgi:ABC-type bacteriocin/lantibiotic exporter with double-glycine peptidase domain